MLFISYSAKDRECVEQLKAELVDEGFKLIFVDSDWDSGIRPGADWKKKLHDNLRSCVALIVLHSNNWRNSDWCPYELGYARAIGKPIFPVLIDNTALVGMAAEYQAVRLFDNRRAAIERLCQSLREQLRPQDTIKWPQNDNPYPGLAAFDERYAAVYFGRDNETNQVLGHLRTMRNEGQPRLLLIHGGSGSGKSSLLKAGVLPRLDSAHWVVLPALRLKENDTIFDQLARDLVAKFPPARRADWKSVRDSLRNENMQVAAKSFLDMTLDLTMAMDKQDATVLIVIDQFEEFLTTSATVIAGQFLKLLKAVFGHNNGRLLAIGTIRSDYLDAYQSHPDALMAPFFQNYLLGNFPHERIADVVVKPAERVGVNVEAALLNKIQDDTPDSKALPLLAYTLEKLFRNFMRNGLLELAAYEELGGMKGAIQQSVDRITASLSTRDESALRLSFVKHLSQIDDNNVVVRLSAHWSALPLTARPLLEKFVEDRLLVKTGDTVEVAHEAIFLYWDKLKEWLRQSTKMMQWRGDVRRDRRYKNWDSLSPVQLAVGRELLKTQRDELDHDEVGWIEKGILAGRNRQIRRWCAVVLIFSVSIIALQQFNSARENKIEVKRNRATNDMQVARYEIDRGNLALAELLLWQAYHNAPEHDPTRKIARHLLGSWSRYLKTPLVHDGPIHSVAFSADGRTILTGSDDSTAQLWDTGTGLPIGERLLHGDIVNSVAFSPDGQTVLTGSFDKTARLWDAHNGSPGVCFRGHGDAINCVAYCPDRLTIVTGSSDKTARLWDLQSGSEKTMPLQHQAPINCVAFSPDGQTVVTGAHDGRARFWDVRTGLPRTPPLEHNGSITCLAFSPDGQTVIVGCSGNPPKVWDADTGIENSGPLEFDAPIICVAFSSNGRTVLTGSTDRTARLWDVNSGSPIGQALEHQGSVMSVAVGSDGRTVLTGSYDHTARLWVPKTGVLKTFRHQGPVYSVAFSPDSRLALTGSFDRIARLWDVEPDLHRDMRMDDPVNAMAFSPDGQLVLSVDKKGAVRLWDAMSGSEKKGHFKPRGGPFNSVAFSPNSQMALFGGADGAVQLYEVGTGRMTLRVPQVPADQGSVRSVTCSTDGKTVLAGTGKGAQLWDINADPPRYRSLPHDGPVYSVALSSDGKTVLTGSDDRTARLWDVTTGLATKAIPLQHRSQVYSVAFSPDGQTALTGSDDHTARLWEAATGRTKGKPLEHEGWVYSVAFSPDGQTVLTGSRDKTARLWDANTGLPRTEPLQHSSFVISVAFGRDGRTLITGSADGVVRRWDIAPPAADEPERLRLSVEVRTGFYLDEQGTLNQCSRKQWLERRKQLIDRGGFCDIRTWDELSEAEQDWLGPQANYR